MRPLTFTTLALTALLVGCGNSTTDAEAAQEYEANNASGPPEAQHRPPFVTIDVPLETLLGLVERRLAIAEPVALHKWDNATPVHAALRERQVVSNARNSAWRFKLTEERAATFMTEQIEANKLVQYQLLHSWRIQGEAPDTPRRDLQNDIRPQLDTLQAELLQTLASFDNHYRPDCAQRLALAIDSRALQPPLSQAMVRATGQLCHNP